MKNVLAAVAMTVASVTGAAAQGIEIRQNGGTPASIGTDKLFSGHVVVTPLYPATDITRASTGLVTFAPGARTAWHTHPAGQMLIVTIGQGWIQQEGQQRQVMNAGDVVWIPAGVKHWHGATNDSQMAHIAVSYMQGDKNVDWMELVTEEQYRK